MSTTTERQRQQAFQKLRPVCVELSEISLKFKAQQVPVKDVLHALEAQHQVLVGLGKQNQLDAKLAEYAYFPIPHILNEAQKLPSSCLETIIQSLIVLTSQGWRQQMNVERGKQMLILMNLLAGGRIVGNVDGPTDELKRVAFQCIATVVKWLSATFVGESVLDDQATRNVVDQLVYLLIDSVSESAIDFVQIAAVGALLEIHHSVRNRVQLASFLPQVVSSLTKALRPSTKARRTQKVLSNDLQLLRVVLQNVLADRIALPENLKTQAEHEALGKSWLQATAAQIKISLSQVVKLRTHDGVHVRQSLVDLCTTVIEECSQTLTESLPIILETLVILSGHHDDPTATAACKHLIISRPDLEEMLRSSLYNWTQSLPRIMQSNDDRPKELMLSRVANSLALLNEASESMDSTVSSIATAVQNTVVAVIETDKGNAIQVQEENAEMQISFTPETISSTAFNAVLLNHHSQKASLNQLYRLLESLRHYSAGGKITRRIVDGLAGASDDRKIASTWLALQLLKPDGKGTFDIDDLLEIGSHDRDTSHAYLVQDLYFLTKDCIMGFGSTTASQNDWRMTALSLEVLVLQSQQLGVAYRDELYETLYPVLTLLSSGNSALRSHGMKSLNLLAQACQYSSATDMVMANIDYLVNSIAWKLNTFDPSPEAPQVLNMIVKLVGAKLIPYLDDLIASIFAALDNYHGYPVWVEMLFAVLKTMVEESARQPILALTEGKTIVPSHRKKPYSVSTVTEILDDVRARKKRKLKYASADERESAPQRPWSKALDDPTYRPPDPEPSEELSIGELLKEDESSSLPQPKDEEEDNTRPVSKSHDLLLKIAQSTVPHLSSPSPKVRHLLLQLLIQIIPLLSQHENTFLPFLNDVWPAIVTRIFAPSTSTTSNSNMLSITSNPYESDYNESGRNGDEMERELPYNTIVAIQVATSLIETAGSFMASRVEQILPQTLKLFSDTYSDVEAKMKKRMKNEHNNNGGTTSIQNLSTTESTKTLPHPLAIQSTSIPTSSSTTPIRTPQSQLLACLIPLLTTMLEYASLSLDQGDTIFQVFIPVLKSGYGSESVTQSIRDAMQVWNSDWLWLVLEESSTNIGTE